jgi:Tfp pilus assembly protein PilO
VLIILVAIIFYIVWITFVVYPKGLEIQQLQRELSQKRLKLTQLQVYPIRERQLDNAIAEEESRIARLKERVYTYKFIPSLLKDIEDISKKYGIEVLSLNGPNLLEKDNIGFNFSVTGSYLNFVPWAYELSTLKALNIIQLNAKNEENKIVYSGVFEISPLKEESNGK